MYPFHGVQLDAREQLHDELEELVNENALVDVQNDVIHSPDSMDYGQQAMDGSH